MDENEAYWAGLVASTIMLGSGFSLLLFPMFTGYGAIILSLGIMTMIVVLITKALIIQIQKWMDCNARIEETAANIIAMRQQIPPNESETQKPKETKVEQSTCEPRIEPPEEEEIAAE